MMTFRTLLDELESQEDLVRVTDPTHWDGAAASVASEAVKNSCPAVLFEETPGKVRFASGAYAGPDQLVEHDQSSWRRVSTALGLGPDCQYIELLDHLAESEPEPIDGSDLGEPAGHRTETDLYSLGLPSITRGERPLVTLGLIAAERDGTSTWAPVRGRVQHTTGMRLSVPEAFADWYANGTEAMILLGVSGSALIAAAEGWTGERATPEVPELAAGLSDISLAEADSVVVPAAVEARFTGEVRDVEGDVGGPEAAWERTCDVTTIEIDIERSALREDPIVPFTPLGSPLTDDVLLTSLVESAELYRRVNSYWGVSPVNWIRLPFEARLGLCIVSSEILYAGFEWQLANTLFSFSRLFDKVLVLDEQADPTNLARALDDMWVKAHPANDWTFSEPNAPSASAPRYRRDGETGTRLYINATWDPRWDEEYIAPRVTFESSYPENIREAARERWNQLTHAGGNDE
ncbi:UbiD family decarboxylase [Natronoarchaeum sp. GCM10025703]|uniref:UbiD family decarboxylase n=1 Tax=unclassified Natronoarchaeum TaxID=2620183 RepID=UPI0036128747